MGFMSSPPEIYNTIDPKGWLREQQMGDMYLALAPMLQRNFHWDPTTHRLVNHSHAALSAETPWCHTRQLPEKHCNLDHGIIFNTWGIIHPRCLECWKVVVTPKTFKQLLQLEELQHAQKFPCKCGIELRDYTPKFYGGYYYNNSLDEGRACWEQVKKDVEEHIGKDVADGVILKRGCTEYEMIKGPSPYWHVNADEEKFLEIIDMYVDFPRVHSGQPEFIKKHVRQKWALWAHMNNDMSYTEFNGGEQLFPGYVRFHEGDIDDIKRDLMVARGENEGVNAKVTDNFIDNMKEFSKQTKTPMQSLNKIMGNHLKNPLYAWNALIGQTPEEAKGEHNELTSEVPVAKDK